MCFEPFLLVGWSESADAREHLVMQPCRFAGSRWWWCAWNDKVTWVSLEMKWGVCLTWSNPLFWMEGFRGKRVMNYRITFILNKYIHWFNNF